MGLKLPNSRHTINKVANYSNLENNLLASYGGKLLKVRSKEIMDLSLIKSREKLSQLIAAGENLRFNNELTNATQESSNLVKEYIENSLNDEFISTDLVANLDGIKNKIIAQDKEFEKASTEMYTKYNTPSDVQEQIVGNKLAILSNNQELSLTQQAIQNNSEIFNQAKSTMKTNIEQIKFNNPVMDAIQNNDFLSDHTQALLTFKTAGLGVSMGDGDSLVNSLRQITTVNYYAKAMILLLLILDLSQSNNMRLLEQQRNGMEASGDASDLGAFILTISNISQQSNPKKSALDILKDAIRDRTSDTAKKLGNMLDKYASYLSKTPTDDDYLTAFNNMINGVNSKAMDCGSDFGNIQLPVLSKDEFTQTDTAKSIVSYQKNNTTTYSNFTAAAGTFNQKMQAYISQYQKTMDAGWNSYKEVLSSYNTAINAVR